MCLLVVSPLSIPPEFWAPSPLQAWCLSWHICFFPRAPFFPEANVYHAGVSLSLPVQPGSMLMGSFIRTGLLPNFWSSVSARQSERRQMSCTCFALENSISAGCPKHAVCNWCILPLFLTPLLLWCFLLPSQNLLALQVPPRHLNVLVLKVEASLFILYNTGEDCSLHWS